MSAYFLNSFFILPFLHNNVSKIKSSFSSLKLLAVPILLLEIIVKMTGGVFFFLYADLYSSIFLSCNVQMNYSPVCAVLLLFSPVLVVILWYILIDLLVKWNVKILNVSFSFSVFRLSPVFLCLIPLSLSFSSLPLSLCLFPSSPSLTFSPPPSTLCLPKGQKSSPKLASCKPGFSPPSMTATREVTVAQW